jgi:hypothetical protein
MIRVWVGVARVTPDLFSMASAREPMTRSVPRCLGPTPPTLPNFRAVTSSRDLADNGARHSSASPAGLCQSVRGVAEVAWRDLYLNRIGAYRDLLK